jgi:hypothetical protein
MVTKQLSVFIENRQGRLGEVLRVLKENDVNIQSLSLADTTEYGLLRLIVDHPEEGREKLLNAGFSAMLTDVLIVKVPHTPGGLQDLLIAVSDSDINVEYMYGLTITGTEALVVVKTSDLQKALKIFGE